MIDKTTLVIVYGVYLVILSIITFFMYGIDKRKAKKGKWRVPEKVLLLSSFLGGAFGGAIGMKVFRHKTTGEHWYFTAINILGIIAHATLLILIAFVFPL